MTGMLLMMVMLLSPAPEQDATPAGDPVDVQTRLSQSAVWLGDEIQYSIRLVMGRGVQAQPESASPPKASEVKPNVTSLRVSMGPCHLWMAPALQGVN